MSFLHLVSWGMLVTVISTCKRTITMHSQVVSTPHITSHDSRSHFQWRQFFLFPLDIGVRIVHTISGYSVRRSVALCRPLCYCSRNTRNIIWWHRYLLCLQLHHSFRTSSNPQSLSSRPKTKWEVIRTNDAGLSPTSNHAACCGAAAIVVVLLRTFFDLPAGEKCDYQLLLILFIISNK